MKDYLFDYLIKIDYEIQHLMLIFNKRKSEYDITPKSLFDFYL